MKVLIYLTCVSFLLLLHPVLTEEKPAKTKATEKADDESENSWQQLTSWFRKKKNPYRTSSSDIVTRGRRNPFTPPALFADPPKDIDKPVNNAGAAFWAKKERQLQVIQKAYDKLEYMKVVVLAKPFLKELSSVTVPPDYEERAGDLERTVINWRDTARETIESQGMVDLNNNIESMKEAFKDGDYDKLRKISLDVQGFVNEWDFSEVDRQKVADAKLKMALEMLRRGKLREEFDKISIKITFRIVSQDVSIPSTATINGKSLSEGSALSENLIVKKINDASILFEFKGEAIEYDIE